MKSFCTKFLILEVAILLVTQELTVIAQEGSPFQTDFTSSDESLNENYSICTDHEGVLIIANRKGILTFDVEEWKLVKTPELPLIVASEPKSNRVFIGCRNNIGILQKNELGEYEYISLVGKEAGAVTQIAFINNYAYFMSQSVISRVNMNNMNDVRYWKSKAGDIFITLMVLKNKLLVDTKDGLQTPEDKGMQPFLTNFPLNGSIVFSLPFDENTIMIGASDNKCYLFDGKTLKNFQLQDQQYLSDGIINDGRILDHGKIVISTSGAGCLVFEMKTGKTVFTANYQTGLPDDEIYALGTDRNNGIWLAHNYGLTRIDAEIPVKNYTTFKGLSGNIQTLEFLNRKLFIGTSNGVYFLDKKKDFVEYTIKQAQAASIAAPASAKTTEGSVQVKETKKGFFGRLFSKKQKSTEDPATSNSETQEKTSSLNFLGESSREKATQKKIYRITSVSHVFTKVQGFEHKCKQLFMFNGQLIAITISGVYEISEKRATSILPNIEANYAYVSPSENSIYLCTNKGVVIAKKIANSWRTIKFPVSAGEPVYSFAKDMFDNCWIGSENKVYKAKINKDGSIKGLKIFAFSSEYRERMIVRISNRKPLFFLSSGIYSIINDSIQPDPAMSKFVSTDTKYYFTQQEYTWIRNGNKWISLSVNAEPDSIAPNYLNLFDNISQIHADNNSNLWIINNNLNLYKIDQKGIAAYKSDFSVFIKRFSGISGENFSLYGVELSKSNRSLKIHISAPYFIKPNSNQYQYILKGLMAEWSQWTTNPEIDLLLAKSGKYELNVRAKNIFGKISNEQALSFKIKSSFYASWWFILLSIMAGLYSISLVIKFRERNLKEEKEILEAKVQERTHQIAEQKEHIELQYNALALQNEKITKQKEDIQDQSNKIAVQNREIKDSIRYAKRLQTAVMPDNTAIGALLSDYFVFFRPKAIVSGDFYWIFKKNEKVIIAAADCTGHGVPGGFLSMLGISFLNELSVIDKNFKANELLNLLKARMKSTLIKEGHSEGETQDGMDIALCIIDPKANKMQYAGANNALYMIRKKELIVYKPDKMPIGTFFGENVSFTNNDIDLQTNDILYLFTDGFRDQLGGEHAKRLKSSGFRQLLLDVHEKPMSMQKEELGQFFDNWRGEYEQVDDILVFGVRI